MLQNMTEGEPLKLILPFMIPLLIGNVFQQLYNIADVVQNFAAKAYQFPQL